MSRPSFVGDLGSSILGAAYEHRLPLAILAVVGIAVVLVVARRRGWFAAARRHPVVTSVAVLGVVVIGAPVAWYLVSPVIVSTRLEEPPPVVAVTGPTSPPSTLSPAPSVRPTAPGASPGRATPGPSPTVSPTPTVPTPAPAQTGEFTGADGFHFGRGTVTLLETAPGEFTLRFDEFAVRNGPDLYVYLSPKPNGFVDGAIEVARLKADEGSFNQPIPPGTDVSAVRSVLIWCKQFSQLFAVAPLAG